MEVFFAVGAGAGLATLAGVRAFLPLAVFMFMARLDWLWGFPVKDTPLDFLLTDTAIVVLLALVVLEVILTRVSSPGPAERGLRLPAAVIAGGLLMAAAVAAVVQEPWCWAGLGIGAALALLGVYVHRGTLQVSEGRDPGPVLDITVLLLSALMMLVPPAGYLFLLFMIWLAYRVRRLKRRKYKGLRILA